MQAGGVLIVVLMSVTAAIRARSRPVTVVPFPVLID